MNVLEIALSVFVICFAVILFLPSAFGEIVEQGTNYDKILVQQNPDGTTVYTNKMYLYDRILDGNVYRDYIFTDAADHLRVETMGLSVKLDKTTCEFSIFDEGIIGGKTPLLVDDIIPYQSVSGSGIWNRVTSVDDAACQATWDGAELKARKSNTVGYIEYVFMHKKDGSWKTELRVKNESGLNNRQFGFRQIFELNRDTISFGGAQRNLDNFDGQVFGRTWLEDNEAKVIELMTGQRYDLDLAFPKLSRVWVNDTGANSSQLTFEYFYNQTILPSGSLLVIDPTFTDTTSSDGRVFSTAVAGTACSATASGKDSTSLNIGKDDSDLVAACTTGWIEFDISSASPDWLVLNATLEYDVTTAVLATACTWRQTTVQPSVGAMQTLYDNAFSGVPLGESDSACTTVANGKIFTFNTTGVSSLNTAIDASQSWYGVAAFYTNQARVPTGNTATIFRQNDAILSFTYSTAIPEPPTGLSCTGIPFGYDCTWTAGANATDVTGYYISHSPNNSTWSITNQTLTGNVTTYQYLGFGNGESNYVRVNATISNVYNTTSSNHVFATTDVLPDAPQTGNTEPTGETSIRIRWNPPLDDGGDAINGYGVRYFNHTAPAGWQTVIANTTTTTLNYNFTGLHSGHTYTFGVNASNGVGSSLSFSANMTATTWEIPDGTVSIATGNVGDVIQVNATVTMTNGSPDPEVTQLEILQDNVVVKTVAESVTIPTGDSDTLDPAWYQILDDLSHTYAARITATNGTVSNTWVTTSNVTLTREYDPDYETAIDPAEGLVNYTTSRTSDQDTVLISINRDKGGTTFSVECLLQTQPQAQADLGQGTWINQSGVGYYNTSISNFADSPLYGSCWNDGELLIFQNYGNGSLILFGIEAYDITFGEYLGVPVGVFFIVMLAGAASQRTAPTWIVILLAVAGVMATIGFFSLDNNIWALALVAGLLGLIVGRKFF